ncbi:unnamed protein product [Schistosoma rodhaini]|uniref:Phlebovirus glycoprotein G2 fusion domain-containing protein n=1 Tax=Schistosoma rodhaini TaxID=6188 RepID=A0AA85G302_9TREM|nr:unnamed protein product [Schistosoma rodhaini]
MLTFELVCVYVLLLCIIILKSNIEHSALIILATSWITDNDGITIIQQVHLIQKQQNLDIGNCQNHSDDYCESHIRNSICNRIKNECFCRLGFVAIRENNEIVCRPILTDLPCRVDSDCVHVDLSVCHPGAGRCICPGNTVYVTHLHACRTKLFHQNYDACRMCDTNHVCHEIMSRDLNRVKDLNIIVIKLDGTLNSSNEPAFVGCTCEFNPVSNPTIIPTGSQNPEKHHLCSENLPDIGEACDHSYLACRSRTAQCVSGDSPNTKVCTCPENTVAVYQTFLNYFECFPVVNKSFSHLTNTKNVVSDDCQPCQKINGTCYDQNNDGIPDGCQCPPGRSFIYKGDQHENSRNIAGSINLIQYKDKLKFPCELKHTETKCDEQNLTVCYLPHSSGRFQTLPYYLQLNMVDVSLVQSMYGESFDREQSCSLSSQLNRISNTLDAKKIYPSKFEWYCITLLNDQLLMDTCKVKLDADSTCSELTNTQDLRYSGSVYLRLKNQIYPDDKAILEIPWTCTAKRICNLEPKPINKITNQQVENNLGQLYVMNKNNEITTETGEGESVYLELIFKYEKFAISTKMCAVASLKFPESFNLESVIDIHLCQAFYHFKYYVTDQSIVNSYKNQTIFISDIPSRIQNNNTSFYRESEIFRAYRLIPQQNTVYYICHIPPLNASMGYRIDSSMIRDWCDISNKQVKLSAADHLFITKLIIRNSSSSHHIKCTLLSCFSLDQVAFICCSLLLTNLTVCITVIWVCKRKQQLKQHQLQYTFSQNLHSKQLLNDSLRCPILSATTPQEVGGTQQQPVYHDEFGTCLNYKVYDEFEPFSRTNCPKCMASMIDQTNSLLPSYQTTRSISQVSMKESLKQPSNEDLIYLDFFNRHSNTALQKCRVQPISGALTNRPTPENSNI